MASRWWPFQTGNQKFQMGGTIYAGPAFERSWIKRSRLRRRRFLAIACIHARRRLALTAPAVFDGSRVAMPSKRPRRCLQNLLPPAPAPAKALKRITCSASEDWSTVTPAPMVELSEIFCRYWPLAVDGLALIRSSSSACRLLLQRRGVEAGLADRAVDDAGLVGAVTHLARLGVLHGFGRVRRHGADLRVRHQAARTEHLAQLADHAHRVRRGDDDVVVEVAGEHLLGQVVHADGFGAGGQGFVGLGAGRGEHRHAHRLAGAGGQHGRTAHLLVGLLGIDAEAHGDVDGLRRTWPCCWPG